MAHDGDDMTGRDAAGRFLVGNRIWELGPPPPQPTPAFKTPDDLRAACLRYFEYVHENPLLEEVVAGKDAKRVTLSKMHAMTVQGLCIVIGINRETWYEYAKKDGFKDVCAWATDVMFAQKFTGAAAGLLNHAIIARELGLADKVEQTGEISITVSPDDAAL